jgi:hypothetical protein
VAYSVRGRPADPAQGADIALFNFWNPNTSDKKISVLEVGYSATAGIATGPQRFVIQRTSAAGTPGSTVTPDAECDWDHDRSPASGCLLYLASFSVQPTFLGPELYGQPAPAASGSIGWGWVWPNLTGIVLDEGTGIALKQLLPAASTALRTGEVYICWEEGDV